MAASFGWAIWVCLLFVAFAANAAEESLRLLLRDEQGAPVFSIPVADGDMFAITYTHSVAKTPVTDYFLIKDAAIWLDRTVYQDFGAGLPHTPEHGQQLRQKDGKLILSGYNKKLGSFDLRVGRTAGHQLILFSDQGQKPAVEKVVTLDSLARGGAIINFSVVRQDH